MVTFDPASILRPSDPPPAPKRAGSPLLMTLDHFTAGDHDCVEVLDLLGYPAETWRRKAKLSNIYWRSRKIGGERRYWLDKHPMDT